MIEPHSACGATGPGGSASEGRFSRTPPGLGEGPPRPKPRRSAGFPLPRPLPWSTPLSRAWPGTLIACWTVLTTCVILSPRWSTLLIVGGLLLLASLIVRLPLGVAPRPPMWFVSGFIGGCIGAWLGDGLELFLRVSTLALVVLWGSGLIAWVTPTASLAAALRFFLRPLRPDLPPCVPWRSWASAIA